jgi:hypothetical protein
MMNKEWVEGVAALIVAEIVYTDWRKHGSEKSVLPPIRVYRNF